MQPRPEPEPPEQPALSERTSLDTLGSDRHDTRSKPVSAEPTVEGQVELERLAAATRTLHDVNTIDHHEIVVALRALADALAVTMPQRPDLVTSIRSKADLLERSPTTSLEHADLVRIALDAARTIVAQGEPHNRWQLGPYARAVTAFTEAETAIDPDRPLLEQHAQVVTAFDGAVSVLELAAGVDVPRG